MRVEIGNPPGKKGSTGDVINWEWLLTKKLDFRENELVVVGADGDFESELHKGKPKEFLLREWSAENPSCEFVLYKTLTFPRLLHHGQGS